MNNDRCGTDITQIITDVRRTKRQMSVRIGGEPYDNRGRHVLLRYQIGMSYSTARRETCAPGRN
ncbi:hypothetical protein NECAME_17160 [Necator americanus]|uniref:Uncharacterized protein n=1 Tax=Necator americanus TaxID=51031 RepID=W2TTF3_NECAM|nr:hypothetical protein NECAME_17160 [Necator americanus]ETN84327.1 hypothetical protein NECAME_17160 [Necator americanus]